MTAVRLLPFADADGPTNMAADEVLLEAAIAGTSSLRFYTWSVPTLSLGYFQPEAARHTDPLLASLPFVRRTTGGATLVHHHELTYAMALPNGPAWQPRGQSWICRMHGIIAAALNTLGVAAHAVTCEEEKKLHDVICFLHHTTGDLVLNGHKIAGSAQRKARGALLQHGAILLAQSSFTPALPGVRELAGPALSPHDVASAVRFAFVGATQWQVAETEWSVPEPARTRELVVEKYAAEAWSRKR